MGKNDHIFAIQHAIIPSFSTWKHIKCLEVLHTQIAVKLLISAPICRDTRYGNKQASNLFNSPMFRVRKLETLKYIYDKLYLWQCASHSDTVLSLLPGCGVYCKSAKSHKVTSLLYSTNEEVLLEKHLHTSFAALLLLSQWAKLCVINVCLNDYKMWIVKSLHNVYKSYWHYIIIWQGGSS